MNTVRIEPGIFEGTKFESVKYPADDILLRVTSAGNVQVAEYFSEDREGPPPHRHEWDEVEYVIEGTVEFWIGGQWTRGGPGTVQMLPAGVAHSVRVPSGRARVLMVTIGAPYDGFARDVSRLLAAGPGQSGDLAELAARHGVRLAGDERGASAAAQPVTLGGRGVAMTVSRKWKRPISVDGREYLWWVRDNDDPPFDAGHREATGMPTRGRPGGDARAAFEWYERQSEGLGGENATASRRSASTS